MRMCPGTSSSTLRRFTLIDGMGKCSSKQCSAPKGGNKIEKAPWTRPTKKGSTPGAGLECPWQLVLKHQWDVPQSRSCGRPQVHVLSERTTWGLFLGSLLRLLSAPYHQLRYHSPQEFRLIALKSTFNFRFYFDWTRKYCEFNIMPHESRAII